MQYNLMVFSMYRVPTNSNGNGMALNVQRPWNVEPYKLPSLEVQCELIRFWSKHPLLAPNDADFRTLYLLRWLCRMPSDITISVQIWPDGAFIVNSLVNMM